MKIDLIIFVVFLGDVLLEGRGSGSLKGRGMEAVGESEDV